MKGTEHEALSCRSGSHDLQGHVDIYLFFYSVWFRECRMHDVKRRKRTIPRLFKCQNFSDNSKRRCGKRISQLRMN